MWAPDIYEGYIRTGFSGGTIEGIQSLLIGVPSLAGFCSKFYLFFTALGCGAYFLAPVGVVTSVIGRWVAGRLPRMYMVVYELKRGNSMGLIMTETLNGFNSFHRKEASFFAGSPLFLQSGKGKSKALKAKSSDIDEYLDDEDSKMKSYITRQFKKFMKNANGKGFNKDHMDEEEELVESKFEKMDEQDDIHTAYAKLYKVSEKHEKLYRLTTKKLSDVELEYEELSTKFDESNQTIGALRFENNFLAKKIKKLEAKLFQVRAQLERPSSVKLDKMLNIQKSISDRTGLGYDFCSLSIASTSSPVFVPPTNNVEIEKIN
ncbi:hypothetical protein SO802_021506 [Lithocarpus litseifolius]|uniref:Uncharacterized protein n=1 Tax=Lithocarpus litseifolius TaxID=425828 RepID=A0AAW2CII6_9ROSI